MNRCVHCFQAPAWKFAHWTSAKTCMRTWSLVCWCAKCSPFEKRAVFIPQTKLPEVEAAWDAFTEELFAAYTTGWTEEQRASFRRRWLHEPLGVHVVGQMSLAAVVDTKRLCEAVKASSIDPDEDERPF